MTARTSVRAALTQRHRNALLAMLAILVLAVASASVSSASALTLIGGKALESRADEISQGGGHQHSAFHDRRQRRPVRGRLRQAGFEPCREVVGWRGMQHRARDLGNLVGREASKLEMAVARHAFDLDRWLARGTRARGPDDQKRLARCDPG